MNEWAPKGQCRNLSKTNKIELEYKSKYKINIHEYILIKIWLNKLMSGEETNFLRMVFPNIFVNILPSRKWSITPYSLSMNYLGTFPPEGTAMKRVNLTLWWRNLTNTLLPGDHSEYK